MLFTDVAKYEKFIRQTIFFFINLLKLDSNREIFYTQFFEIIKPNIR